MKISVSSTPMGSVATSAVPALLHTCLISSGNAFKSTFSTMVLVATDSSRLVPASRTVPNAIAPSESLGINSAPRFGATMPNENAITTNAKARTAVLCLIVAFKTGT